jgi:hypothetical protein
MQNIKNNARALDSTFWIGNKNDTVYGIFQNDKSLYPNTDIPYRLTFIEYNSGLFVNANAYTYPGGILLNGTLQISGGINGTMQNSNTIFWNNGDVWNRVSEVPKPTTNYTDIRNKIDERESAWLNNKINNTYKTSWNYYPGENL